MTHRAKERLAGLFILVASAVLTAWNWYDALNKNYYYPKLAIIGPALGCVGLGLVLFPSYRAERTARGEDISQLNGFRLLTTRWWIILIVALGAGFLDLYLLWQLGG